MAVGLQDIVNNLNIVIQCFLFFFFVFPFSTSTRFLILRVFLLLFLLKKIKFSLTKNILILLTKISK